MKKPKSLGQIAYEADPATIDDPWETASPAERATYARIAAAVAQEVERRQLANKHTQSFTHP